MEISTRQIVVLPELSFLPTKARLCAQALCILHRHKSHSTGGCMDEHLFFRRGTMTAVSAAYLQGIFFGGCRDTKFPKMFFLGGVTKL